MIRSNVSGHFIQGSKGPIFVLLRQPASAPVGCVLVVPPFAEEMNKCRRMVTEVAHNLTARGVATVLPDLYGTGDSGGDFEDGDWATWRADLAASCSWAASVGHPVTSILAIRLGCALATDALRHGELSAFSRAAFWQPVFDGQRFLNQFLRLRVAAGLMEDRKENLADLKARLASGEAVEVAGYRISGRLAADLDVLAPPECLPSSLGAVAWFEVVREAGLPLQRPSLVLIDRTRGQGGSIVAESVAGEPFWSATEIVVIGAMVDQTASHLFSAESRIGSGET